MQTGAGNNGPIPPPVEDANNGPIPLRVEDPNGGVVNVAAAGAEPFEVVNHEAILLGIILIP
ncbi:hypothetical protein RHGRI_022076 [Rhododendron griersonianum]|uniref:Uncharacterized protein n=1 Tax=Rhododendron griersonianum TaxID=479676 RepID=A0AAV6JS14_9ERIC|nr:hypothetical protein RHGRI_022076 [Rhododendron griersonianum]